MVTVWWTSAGVLTAAALRLFPVRVRCIVACRGALDRALPPICTTCRRTSRRCGCVCLSVGCTKGAHGRGSVDAWWSGSPPDAATRPRGRAAGTASAARQKPQAGTARGRDSAESEGAARRETESAGRRGPARRRQRCIAGSGTETGGRTGGRARDGAQSTHSARGSRAGYWLRYSVLCTPQTNKLVYGAGWGVGWGAHHRPGLEASRWDSTGGSVWDQTTHSTLTTIRHNTISDICHVF